MTICIVGNGIIGMMTAYALSQRVPQLPVTVIGRRARPGCASLAAAAMFNSFCEIEAGTLENEIERRRFLFNRESNSLWPELLKEIAKESKLPLNYGFGTFLIKNPASDALEDENYDAIRAALREFKEPHSDVAAKNMKGYKPAAAKRLNHATYIDREGWVNPVQLLAALEAILAKRKQVTFIDAQAERIDCKGGKVGGVRLESGEMVAAEQVVACNGAEFTALMDRSGLKQFQRVFYGVGCTVLLDCGELATDHCIRTPNRGLACGLYTAPQSKTEVVVGASNFISPTPEAEPRIGSVYTLLKGVMEQINSDYYKARLVRVNTGWRPTSSDTLPLIGPTSVGGLLVATGTKRDGFHCSPVIADYLCDMLLDGTSKADMALYRPERPLTRLYTRAQAIEKYARHTINALYQHDLVPAKGKMMDDLDAYYRQEYAALHDQIGAQDWGIPLEMKDMYKYGHVR